MQKKDSYYDDFAEPNTLGKRKAELHDITGELKALGFSLKVQNFKMDREQNSVLEAYIFEKPDTAQIRIFSHKQHGPSQSDLDAVKERIAREHHKASKTMMARLLERSQKAHARHEPAAHHLPPEQPSIMGNGEHPAPSDLPVEQQLITGDRDRLGITALLADIERRFKKPPINGSDPRDNGTPPTRRR